jgi:hypothetical protein
MSRSLRLAKALILLFVIIQVLFTVVKGIWLFKNPSPLVMLMTFISILMIGNAAPILWSSVEIGKKYYGFFSSWLSISR